MHGAQVRIDLRQSVVDLTTTTSSASSRQKDRLTEAPGTRAQVRTVGRPSFWALIPLAFPSGPPSSHPLPLALGILSALPIAPAFPTTLPLALTLALVVVS